MDNPDNSFKLTYLTLISCVPCPSSSAAVCHDTQNPFNVSSCAVCVESSFKIRDTMSWQIMKLVSCLLSRCLLSLFLCAASPSSQYSTKGYCTTNLWDITKPCESQHCVALAAVLLGFVLNAIVWVCLNKVICSLQSVFKSFLFFFFKSCLKQSSVWKCCNFSENVVIYPTGSSAVLPLKLT